MRCCFKKKTIISTVRTIVSLCVYLVPLKQLAVDQRGRGLKIKSRLNVQPHPSFNDK